jgi:hypothetical protein
MSDESKYTPAKVAEYLKGQISNRGGVKAAFSNQFFQHFSNDEASAFVEGFNLHIEGMRQELINQKLEELKALGYKMK